MKKLKNICWAHTSVLVINLNVTSVTELQVNGGVLNHINSVNESNINVIIVIINHPKTLPYRTKQTLLNWKTMKETFEDWKQVPNNKKNMTNQHSFSPAKATSHNSFPKLTISYSSSGDVPQPRMEPNAPLILSHSLSTFMCTIQLLLNPSRLREGNEVQLDYCTCVPVQQIPLWSSWTQGPQILTYSTFTGPPPPKHEIQRVHALHPCWTSIILHDQESKVSS